MPLGAQRLRSIPTTHRPDYYPTLKARDASLLPRLRYRSPDFEREQDIINVSPQPPLAALNRACVSRLNKVLDGLICFLSALCSLVQMGAVCVVG